MILSLFVGCVAMLTPTPELPPPPKPIPKQWYERVLMAGKDEAMEELEKIHRGVRIGAKIL